MFKKLFFMNDRHLVKAERHATTLVPLLYAEIQLLGGQP